MVEQSKLSRTFATALSIGPPSGSSFCSVIFVTGPTQRTSTMQVGTDGTFHFDSGVANTSVVEFMDSTQAYGFWFASNGSGSYLMPKRLPFDIRTPANSTVIQVKNTATGGNVNIGGTAIITGSDMAALYFSCTNRGFMMPRLTTAQRIALLATDGLEVYDTTLQRNMQSDGNYWKES